MIVIIGLALVGVSVLTARTVDRMTEKYPIRKRRRINLGGE